MVSRLLLLLALLQFCLPAPPVHAIKYNQETYQRKLTESNLVEELPDFEAYPFKVITEVKLPPEDQREMARIIREHASRINRDFGYQPEGSAQLILLKGNSYDSVDDPELATGGFYADRKIRLRFQFDGNQAQMRQEFERVFAHEYTHLVIGAIDGGRTPRWLNEGLAVYESKSRSERRRGEGRDFLKQLQGRGIDDPYRYFSGKRIDTLYQLGGDFYRHGYVVAKYLADTHGFVKLQDCFQEMKSGKSFNLALRAVYGLTIEELTKQAYQS